MLSRIRQDCARRHNARRRGFTAFEVLLATSILAIISLSVSTALMAGRAQSANAQNTVYASLLAQELLEEVVRLPYYDPDDGTTYLGASSNETSRQAFDNAGDYLNYTDGAGTTMPTIADLAGNGYPAPYQKFTRTVTIETKYYYPSGWNRQVKALLVTVTVSKDGIACGKVEQLVLP